MAVPNKMQKIEHRAVIKFLTKQGKNQKIIFNEMKAAYEKSAPSFSRVQKWSNEFKRGRETSENDPRAGGLVTATTDGNIKEVEELILENVRIKIKLWQK